MTKEMTETTVRYHVRRREFLNEDPEKPAFIIGVVQDTTDFPDDTENWKYGTVMLEFGDCYRRVGFSLDLSDDKERRNSLSKINLIAKFFNDTANTKKYTVASHDARPHVQDETEAAAA